MRIMVLGNAQREGVREEAERLLPFLREHCELVVYDLLQAEDISCITADVALVLGGDGAILRAARQMGYRQTPVLGINLGKLGFLADLTPEEVRLVFPSVLRGEYRITHHLMFECIVEVEAHAGEVVPPPQTFLGLNEVALQVGPPFHMMELDLIIDDEPVSSYAGDGLIISTPVGSTAHNLSAGGPILGQDLSAFVITPICPHTLTNRPVVESAEKVYTIAIRRAAEGTSLVIDGQEIIPLSARHRITIRKAPVRFGLVKVAGRSFFQILREKLHWGTQPNYRRETIQDPRTTLTPRT